jgi:hypothetical protein
MNKFTLKLVYGTVIILVTASCAQNKVEKCDSSHPKIESRDALPTTSQIAKDSMNIDKCRAEEIAKKEFVKQGYNLKNYSLKTTETSVEWIVSLKINGPQPPGANASVKISKQDSSIVFFKDE